MGNTGVQQLSLIQTLATMDVSRERAVVFMQRLEQSLVSSVVGSPMPVSLQHLASHVRVHSSTLGAMGSIGYASGKTLFQALRAVQNSRSTELPSTASR